MPYERLVSYGLSRKDIKSRTFERRSKRSFRRWTRRKLKSEDNKERYDIKQTVSTV
jgi:hypothetical protein